MRSAFVIEKEDIEARGESVRKTEAAKRLKKLGGKEEISALVVQPTDGDGKGLFPDFLYAPDNFGTARDPGPGTPDRNSHHKMYKDNVKENARNVPIAMGIRSTREL